MAGIKSLRKIQVGTEDTSTPGTYAAETQVLRFTGTMADLREAVLPDEDVGILGGVDRIYFPKTFGEIQIEGPVTYEQLPYVLACGVSEGLAGVADTAGGTGFSYTYTFGTTTQKDINTLTIVAGDNIEAEHMTGCFVPEFSLSGAGGEAWQLSATFRGQTVSDTAAFTGSIAIPAVEEALFSKSTLYIDDSTATFANTARTGVLLAADLKFTTGQQEVYAANGTTTWAFIKQSAPEIVFDLTFEHDATSAAFKDNWRLGVSQQMRIKTVGSAFGTAGALGTKFMQIDAAGVWETFDKIGEQDGNDIIRGTFRVRYSAAAVSAAGLYCTITVANGLTSCS